MGRSCLTLSQHCDDSKFVLIEYQTTLGTNKEVSMQAEERAS